VSDISQSKNLDKDVLKKIKTLTLILDLIFIWARSQDNLKQVLKVSQHTILFLWDLITNHELTQSRKIKEAYKNILGKAEEIFKSYYKKVKKYCFVKNGMYTGLYEFSLQSVNMCEHLGFLTLYAIIFWHNRYGGLIRPEKEEFYEILETIKNFILNHRAVNNPMYDNHIIEISLTCYILSKDENNIKGFIEGWLHFILNDISYAYNSYKQYYPVASDSFESVVQMNIFSDVEVEDGISISTLIPIIMGWFWFFNLKEQYEICQKDYLIAFNKTNYQLWIPDSETDKRLYSDVLSAYETGISEASLKLDVSFEDWNEKMNLMQNTLTDKDNISSIKNDFNSVFLVACLYNRVPAFPFYWSVMKDEVAS
jgi:hypothetical protein